MRRGAAVVAWAASVAAASVAVVAAWGNPLFNYSITSSARASMPRSRKRGIAVGADVRDDNGEPVQSVVSVRLRPGPRWKYLQRMGPDRFRESALGSRP